MFNLDFIYPIGSIYINVNNVNPANLFGGTWERVSQGRCLMGAGKPVQNNNTNHGSLTSEQLTWDFAAGQTLGEYQHVLNISEMPRHEHDTYSGASTGSFPYKIAQTDGYASTSNSWCTTMKAGNDLAHNNIQPSLVVYMWKRTA